MREEEKSKLGEETMHCFVNRLGEPDQHLTILLQVLMEEIFNVPPLYLLSESQQEGDQTSDCDFIADTSELPDISTEQS